MTGRASAGAVGTGSAPTGIKRRFLSGRGMAGLQELCGLMILGFARSTWPTLPKTAGEISFLARPPLADLSVPATPVRSPCCSPWIAVEE